MVLRKQNKKSGSTQQFSRTASHRKELLLRLFSPLCSDIFSGSDRGNRYQLFEPAHIKRAMRLCDELNKEKH